MRDPSHLLPRQEDDHENGRVRTKAMERSWLGEMETRLAGKGSSHVFTPALEQWSSVGVEEGEESWLELV